MVETSTHIDVVKLQIVSPNSPPLDFLLVVLKRSSKPRRALGDISNRAGDAARPEGKAAPVALVVSKPKAPVVDVYEYPVR